MYWNVGGVAASLPGVTNRRGIGCTDPGLNFEQKLRKGGWRLVVGSLRRISVQLVSLMALKALLAVGLTKPAEAKTEANGIAQLL